MSGHVMRQGNTHMPTITPTYVQAPAMPHPSHGNSRKVRANSTRAHPEAPGDRERPRDRRGCEEGDRRTPRRRRSRARPPTLSSRSRATPCARLMSHSSATHRAGVPAHGAAGPEGAGKRIASRERRRRGADRPIRARVLGVLRRLRAHVHHPRTAERPCEPRGGFARPGRGIRHTRFVSRRKAHTVPATKISSHTRAFTNHSTSTPSPVSGARAIWLMP